ncbi:hypothetical protein MBLNU459_g4415t1 [Dothideomycetes sp. NU459]
MKITSICAAAAVSLQLTTALDLDVTSEDSIRSASATLAYGLMSYYKTNETGTPNSTIGTLPPPLYWWEAGACWGALIDYWAYTNDDSYNPTVMQALLAQVGPDHNYMPPAYYSSLGNDDQSFWALAVLSALEYGFPNPPEGSPSWLELAENVFNSMVPRWDTATCGGGLRWQIFSYNSGYDYKNSISNGAFFQMAARLARYTGNSTYLDWAETIWDWETGVGLMDDKYNIYDGTEADNLNCSQLDHIQWTYNSGMFIYGTAILYNYTDSSALWQERTAGLLENANATFFYTFPNATGVMVEQACEPHGTCNNDQYAFKGFLGRWLAKAAVVAPFIKDEVTSLLQTSAQAAAASCSGPTDGNTCGVKWYINGYDGDYGVGQQMSALELRRQSCAGTVFVVNFVIWFVFVF